MLSQARSPTASAEAHGRRQRLVSPAALGIDTTNATSASADSEPHETDQPIPTARARGGARVSAHADSVASNPGGMDVLERARPRRAAAARAQAAVVQGAAARRPALPRADRADPLREPAHRLPGGRLPERRRVLGARHRDVHDPRRHLHAPLRLLQRQDRQADLERPARARARRALDRAHGPAPRRHHLGRPRRPARQGRLRVRRRDPPGPPPGARLPDRGAHARLPGPGDAAREGHRRAPRRVQPQRRGRAAPVSDRAARLASSRAPAACCASPASSAKARS